MAPGRVDRAGESHDQLAGVSGQVVGVAEAHRDRRGQVGAIGKLGHDTSLPQSPGPAFLTRLETVLLPGKVDLPQAEADSVLPADPAVPSRTGSSVQLFTFRRQASKVGRGGGRLG